MCLATICAHLRHLWIKDNKMAQEVLTRTIVVDVGRCLACRSCELACAKAHAGFEDIVSAVLSEARLVPRIRVVDVEGHGVPVQCQHCVDAACVAACPTEALCRDEETGVVLLDGDKCVACMACIIACPFGVIEWHEASESVVKCDLCEGIVGEGEEPRCVAACPTGALRLKHD